MTTWFSHGLIGWAFVSSLFGAFPGVRDHLHYLPGPDY